MTVILSFDVEHWYLGFKTRGIKGWEKDVWRDYKNIDKILSLLRTYNIQATFFITGRYAKDYPDIVKSIDSERHEIACHGYSHEYVYKQTPAVFTDETIRARDILSGLINKRIYGYRAASWSTTKKSLWALEIIQNLGFIYDSSIFPTKNKKYGIYNALRSFYKISFSNNRSIIEYPPQTLNIFKVRIPVGSGVYLRIFPFWVHRLALNRENNQGLPGRVMLHPHELDPNPPKLKVPIEAWIIKYFRIKNVESILNKILEEYNCISYKNYTDEIVSKKLPVVGFSSLYK